MVRILGFHCLAQVQSLVRELRSCKLCNQKTKTKANKKNPFGPEFELEVSVGTHEIVYTYLLIDLSIDLSILALSTEEA